MLATAVATAELSDFQFDPRKCRFGVPKWDADVYYLTESPAGMVPRLVDMGTNSTVLFFDRDEDAAVFGRWLKNAGEE